MNPTGKVSDHPGRSTPRGGPPAGELPAMLKNRNILCFSSIDWDFLWQQHQEIMSTYAAHGNTVLFIENTGVRSPRLSDLSRILHRLKNWRRSLWGFRKERENLFIYSPLILPFPYSRVAQWINRWIMVTSLKWWMRSAKFSSPIIWTFLPTRIVLDIADAIDHQLLVYYATDNFAATSKGAGRIRRIEPEVIRASDLVFVNSQNRMAYCRQFSEAVVEIPMGVSAEVFEEAKRTTLERPDDLKGLPRPIIGYVGGIRQSIDQPLVGRLAQELPDCTLAFVGPAIQTDHGRLKSYANVRFLGIKDHREMPRYIHAFDCCIIPYVKDEYTDCVSAAKLHEYLIMGKPVVATNLAEIERYAKMIPQRMIYVAGNHRQFVDHVREALTERGEHAEERIALARERAWSPIIETMSMRIEETLRRRATASVAWQEQLIAGYRRVTRRVLATVAVVAGCYLLAFYSPLVWWIAAPLKMAQTPLASDAIVVFAGGVGESGKAGQGYAERVGWAVELYQRGFADRLVFSSGYTYHFREPEIMSGLAVSLGVPGEHILLEDQATNTFQNVAYVNDLLDRQGWDEVLLVSSPYHMRRASLVWNHVAPEKRITYVPIPLSRFYAHGREAWGGPTWRQASLEQIRGIAHEYLGIVYYWLKGYIR